MVDGNLLLITSIPNPILSILTLILYKALLASVLKIIGSIDSCSIVLNLTKLFSIYTRIKESLSNIVVKDIKGILLLRPRLLKLKVSNRNLLRIEKLTLMQLPLLIRIRELLLIVYGDFLFIIPILYPILSILALLIY